jgi:hypothetical protein
MRSQNKTLSHDNRSCTLVSHHNSRDVSISSKTLPEQESGAVSDSRQTDRVSRTENEAVPDNLETVNIPYTVQLSYEEIPSPDLSQELFPSKQEPDEMPTSFLFSQRQFQKNQISSEKPSSPIGWPGLNQDLDMSLSSLILKEWTKVFSCSTKGGEL